jgi:hypothetical protein
MLYSECYRFDFEIGLSVDAPLDTLVYFTL